MNIIELAKEAGLLTEYGFTFANPELLKRFATLVAAHEREALAEPDIEEMTLTQIASRYEPVSWIALALEALIYHTQQTRPIQKTDEAIIYLQNLLNKQEQNMTFTLEDAIKKFPEIAYWHSEFEKHNTVTAPVSAKREWVDLTDDEIALAVGSPIDEIYLADFRAVIAKFKEKNTPQVIPQVIPQGEHKTDGTPCWCNPEVTYENPETGAKVIVHKEPQGEPVAWIDKGRLEGIKEGWQPVLSFKQLEDDVPLYTTPPSSQLADAAVEAATSDEEMTKFANGYLAGYEDAKKNAAKLIDNEEIHRGKWFATAIRSMK